MQIRSGPIVVLTGAGISAESGVPTFRGSDRLWENYRTHDLATQQAFNNDQRLVWKFYNWRREIVANCQPNAAHLTLVEIERATPDFTLITQNVDSLHEKAGSMNVIKMHGSLWRMRCPNCQTRWENHAVPLLEPLPSCPECGAIARPDVVWFGESLEPKVLQQAFEAASSAAVILVVGTSAVVQPAAQLPLLARSKGAHVVEINIEQTPLTPHVDEFLQGLATVELVKWWDQYQAGA
jgi:NAD-dependent deacetylase